ncbi:MAG: UDP-N-acetylglucosamine pyrophosphorylase [Bacillota bacterium]|jgi:NDP-sugar pyrophosphorylase family protein
MDQTLTRPLFSGVTYAWEVLPRIKGFLLELAAALPDDFERIAENIWVGRGTTIEPTAKLVGPAIIGYDCAIRHCAYLREQVIIGNGVVVGNSTEVKNAIIFNKAEIPHFNYVGDSVLGYKAHLGAGVIISNLKSVNDPVKVIASGGEIFDTGLRKFGALIGDHAEVGCNAVLNPGTILGRESIVYPLTMARGIIPEKHIVKHDGRIIKRH